jgi:hypothetical protein
VYIEFFYEELENPMKSKATATLNKKNIHIKFVSVWAMACTANTNQENL